MSGNTTRLVLSEYLKYLFAEVRMRFDSVAAESEGADLLRFARKSTRSAAHA